MNNIGISISYCVSRLTRKLKALKRLLTAPLQWEDATWLRVHLNQAYADNNKLTSQLAKMIRDNDNIRTIPLTIEAYRWERTARRNNEKMRWYDFGIRAICKHSVEITDGDHSGYVVCIYDEYGFKIEGL